MSKVEEKVESIISKELEEIGVSIYDVEYAKEGQNYFLRIYIENKVQGVDLDLCEKVSGIVSELLDKEEPIRTQYFLEISSSGVEKVLRKNRHLEENKGKEIKIKLFKAQDGSQEIQGTLEDYTDETININHNQKTIQIDRKMISQIKTIYNW